RKRTSISGVSRVLDRNGPLEPCRRCIKSRKPARLLVHAPLTVTNWASSTSESIMPSASCRPHASLNRNPILRIASSSALVMTAFPVVSRPMPAGLSSHYHIVGLLAHVVDQRRRAACELACPSLPTTRLRTDG